MTQALSVETRVQLQLPFELRLFDRSRGFQLPDGSVLSPDAALIQQHRWDALTPGSSGTALGGACVPDAQH